MMSFRANSDVTKNECGACGEMYRNVPGVAGKASRPISEFRDMKMQPAVERALRHRGLPKI